MVAFTDKPAAMGKLSESVIWWWFLISSLLVIWDFCYCFLRPRSMAKGDLSWIWAPYELYGTVDLLYGQGIYESGDGFTNAQATLNVVETVLNFAYLYLGSSPSAPLIGFTAAVMTLSKTVLYMLNSYFCGWCLHGRTDLSTLILIFVIPNGMWIVFPTLITILLGRNILKNLGVAAAIGVGKANGKSL